MKITYLYQYFGTPKGSWSTRVYELSRRWVKEGHDVTVITAPYEKSDTKAKGFVSEQWVDGIRLIVINSGDNNRMPVWKRVFNAMQFAVVSSIYNLKTPADIVIASSGPITIGIPGILGSLFKKAPLVFEVRDLWPDGGIEMGLIKGNTKIKLSRWFEKLCYNRSKLIITASVGQKQQIAGRFPNAKIEVIPHATDLDLFKPTLKGDSPFGNSFQHVFLHIGSLGFIHNTRYIVEAARCLKTLGREDIAIIFIGEGNERSAMEQLVQQYGIEHLVKFWGIRSKNEVAQTLPFATATLFTTLDNPVQNTCSPNKLYDSFATGKPVIQTTTGWIFDLFETHRCGINVSPTEPMEMAKAMISLADNQELCVEMGANALKLAFDEFNADHLAAKYLHYLLDSTS